MPQQLPRLNAIVRQIVNAGCKLCSHSRCGISHTALFDSLTAVRCIQYEAILIGGSHRLSAGIAIEKDLQRLKGGESTLYDWSQSVFSVERPPSWVASVPATLHFVGEDEETRQQYLSAMGQAQNDLHEALAPSSYYDVMYFIQSQR